LNVRFEALEAAISSKKDDSSSSTKKESDAISRLRKMGYKEDQIEAAKLVYQAVSEQSDSETKKELESVKAQLAANSEKEALNNAIIEAKKSGIEVTPKQIGEFRKQCANSTDPREQLLAEAPYPRIIKMMLMDGMIEKKEDAGDTEDSGDEVEKPRKDPKIPSGKSSLQEKKPTLKGFKYDPGNAQGSLDSLERRVLSRLGSDDNE